MKKISRLIILYSLLISPFAHAEKLKVMIYNTWGVPISAWDTWRFKESMKEIERLNPDIVLLSEMFTAKAKHKFKSKQYPYHADGANWFPRLVGSGLRILSKYPIDLHAILTYNACESTDCLSRKGANLVTVTLPSGKKLNVVGTHLNADGGEASRIDQLKQLNIFSDWYEDKTAPTIIAGDFNFNPLSNEYQYARQSMQVSDAWEDTHSSSDAGFTYDCYENHYAHDYTLKTGGRLFKSRIDYIFLRGNIKTMSTTLEMNTPDNTFSDHYAIMGEFEI
jgi:endonuclease/exonuclease/phosphatase family metal-dependent hydrolase